MTKVLLSDGVLRAVGLKKTGVEGSVLLDLSMVRGVEVLLEGELDSPPTLPLFEGPGAGAGAVNVGVSVPVATKPSASVTRYVTGVFWPTVAVESDTYVTTPVVGFRV